MAAGCRAIFHVTEVGHVAKKFVDCGGTLRFKRNGACCKPWSGPMTIIVSPPARLALTFLTSPLPILTSPDLPVEIEYEDGVISQFPPAGNYR